jgi:hypothetical protein
MNVVPVKDLPGEIAVIEMLLVEITDIIRNTAKQAKFRARPIVMLVRLLPKCKARNENKTGKNYSHRSQ